MPTESVLWAFCCFGIVEITVSTAKAIRATAASTTIARNMASTVKPPDLNTPMFLICISSITYPISQKGCFMFVHNKNGRIYKTVAKKPAFIGRFLFLYF